VKMSAQPQSLERKPRDQYRHYGRAFSKRRIRCDVRSRIEANIRCLKAFNERISAKEPDRQTAEFQVSVGLMNSFFACRMAKIIREA